MVKVWLDDRRTPPDGNWIWVQPPKEAIVLLELDEVEELSLDHDLGLDDGTGLEQTGYDVLRWIDRQVVTAGLTPPKLAVHSVDPLARERMQPAITSVGREGHRLDLDVRAPTGLEAARHT